MTSPEKHPDSFDDDEVDRILRRFFAHEVPEELQRSVAQIELVQQSSTSQIVADNRTRSWTLTVLAATAVALAAIALWVSTSGRPPSQVDLVDGTSDGIVTRATKSEAAASGTIPFSLSQSVKPVESVRYDTVHGLVEQRTNLNTTNVSFIEPETGNLLELTVPELVIEVFPIDDGDQTRATDLDVEKPKTEPPRPKQPRAKLPEEG